LRYDCDVFLTGERVSLIQRNWPRSDSYINVIKSLNPVLNTRFVAGCL
jgi:hypothetical protein